MKFRNLYALATIVGTICACGFEPLYVEKTGGDDLWYYNNQYDTDIVREMAQIKITTVSGRMGQMIKNELIDMFNPQGAPKNAKYFLKLFAPEKTTKEQALRDDITATREKVTYTVTYELWNTENGRLINGSSQTVLSYDLLDNPYSTTMDKKKVEKDGAKIIANDIALRIGAYFHSINTKVGNPDEF